MRQCRLLRLSGPEGHDGLPSCRRKDAIRFTYYQDREYEEYLFRAIRGRIITFIRRQWYFAFCDSTLCLTFVRITLTVWYWRLCNINRSACRYWNGLQRYTLQSSIDVIERSSICIENIWYHLIFHFSFNDSRVNSIIAIIFIWFHVTLVWDLLIFVIEDWRERVYYILHVRTNCCLQELNHKDRIGLCLGADQIWHRHFWTRIRYCLSSNNIFRSRDHCIMSRNEI